MSLFTGAPLVARDHPAVPLAAPSVRTLDAGLRQIVESEIASFLTPSHEASSFKNTDELPGLSAGSLGMRAKLPRLCSRPVAASLREVRFHAL
jgi:hypothetical protein